MNKELLQKKLFTRRAIILGACKMSLVAGLFSRMFYLQILKNKEFSRLSENNRIKTEIIPPLRERILDRNEDPLALNEQNYQLVFEKLEIHNQQSINDIVNKIAKILAFDFNNQTDLISQLNELDLGVSVIITANLTWLQLVDLELHLYDLPGVSVEVGFNRFYPYAELCGHLTGYLGTISDKEILKSSITMYPNLKVGKNGIEKTQEKLLHGITGFKKVEVNAKGEEIRVISTSKSVGGQDIKLTIDVDLQKKIALMLKDTAGVALVSKISTGEILSMVSEPSFDPNLFNNGISLANWNNLVNNPEMPLINRAVSLTYPPGSGFKINTAIAALKLNFNPETRFSCSGHYTLGNRVFHCWKKTGHGSVNLYEAIAGSCNVYFWNVAKIIGIQPIVDIARRLGFGKKQLDDSLPREQAGLIPDPEWKKKNISANWTLADTFNTTIGQGYVDVTPLQILTMVARIATGTEVVPSIIKQDTKKEFASLELERELNIIRKGMEMAVNSSIGTAFRNRITETDLLMAGKTGTSQVISKRHANDDLSLENIEKKIRNHGVFVAYAPLIKPEYAFCGIIEHGGTPAFAVKIAKESLKDAQLRKL